GSPPDIPCVMQVDNHEALWAGVELVAHLLDMPWKIAKQHIEVNKRRGRLDAQVEIKGEGRAVEAGQLAVAQFLPAEEIGHLREGDPVRRVADVRQLQPVAQFGAGLGPAAAPER